jgi:hypothetical protein
VLLGPVAARAQATEKSFTGLYFGVEASALNVIAGAQVSGVDTLAQDTRGAVTFAAGGRYEVSRLVLGIEFGAGWEDGNLALDDSAAALHSITATTHTRASAGRLASPSALSAGPTSSGTCRSCHAVSR